MQPSGTAQPSMRDRDEEMSRQNWEECDQIIRTEVRVLSVFWEKIIWLWNSDGRIAILLRSSSMLNQQSTKKVNGWTEIGGKQTEFIVNRRQMTRTNQQQDNDTPLDQNLVAPALCHIPLWAAGLVTPFLTPAPSHNLIERVSVRVTEHQHEERRTSIVVSWTERVERDRDEEMSRQNRKECDQICRNEARILSVFWQRRICLWNSELSRLPSC